MLTVNKKNNNIELENYINVKRKLTAATVTRMVFSNNPREQEIGSNLFYSQKSKDRLLERAETA